eukprot:1291557-Prymnesium_polylepis.1
MAGLVLIWRTIRPAEEEKRKPKRAGVMNIDRKPSACRMRKGRGAIFGHVRTWEGAVLGQGGCNVPKGRVSY